jgi:hypothetical protein
MAKIPFTNEELGELTNSDLMALADYFDIEYNKYDTKAKLVEAIDRARDPEIYREGSGSQPMSARVRRIYEQNKKGKE